MMSLPQELRESAWIDGAGEFRTLFQIILPLSVPILATVTLWTLVGNWNAWFDAVIYMNDANKMPLQVVLRRIVMEGSSQMLVQNNMQDFGSIYPTAIKNASIYICTIPILCVYPFVQKYFVKGIMVGSLKG